MEALYVCSFSNGHIKVGRSIDPFARIAAHVDRVACLGIELVEHFVADCGVSAVRKETALIVRCAAAAEKQNKNEWFVGLSYPDVCEWAAALAATVDDSLPSTGDTPIDRAFDQRGFQMALARRLGLGKAAINAWRRNGVPVQHCAAFESECGGAVTRRDLRPDDWQAIWPELVEAKAA